MHGGRSARAAEDAKEGKLPQGEASRESGETQQQRGLCGGVQSADAANTNPPRSILPLRNKRETRGAKDACLRFDEAHLLGWARRAAAASKRAAAQFLSRGDKEDFQTNVAAASSEELWPSDLFCLGGCALFSSAKRVPQEAARRSPSSLPRESRHNAASREKEAESRRRPPTPSSNARSHSAAAEAKRAASRSASALDNRETTPEPRRRERRKAPAEEQKAEQKEEQQEDEKEEQKAGSWGRQRATNTQGPPRQDDEQQFATPRGGARVPTSAIIQKPFKLKNCAQRISSAERGNCAEELLPDAPDASSSPAPVVPVAEKPPSLLLSAFCA